MPVYEYTCEGCGHTYESIRPLSRRDDPPPCPECGSNGQRQLSAFAFRNGRYGSFFKAGAPRTKPSDSGSRQDSVS
jgi:putative FmdB family regulatory protein